ncbi:MAG: HlyC/CorC family transporter, partial [Spirochaetia bacterium]|nr:HlyC/CorC family transporter [Spirochaetia bacterium]
MGSFTTDLLIILLLVVLNGFFAGSEIAIISFRKSRVHALMGQGSRTARVIHGLQSNPDSFFATIQIGITVIGTLASVFGGVELVPVLTPYVRMIPYAGNFAEQISFVLLVGGISYLTLVFGELVPKSLALHYSERFALVVAYPLLVFSRVFFAFTRFLTFSSNLFLRLFKDRTSFSETRLSAEEIRHLLEEGVKAGTIERSEHEMIENVLDMNETAAREVMVPRVDMVAVAADMSDDEILKLVETYHSRLPVYADGLDNVMGILHLKDLMRVLARKEKVRLADIVRPGYFVPESMKIGSILKEMQKRKTHMAIVVDEFGGTSGLLT